MLIKKKEDNIFQLNTFYKMAQFDKSVLEKYGITGTTEVVYNPSYEVLFEEETKEGLEGFEKGQETLRYR